MSDKAKASKRKQRKQSSEGSDETRIISKSRKQRLRRKAKQAKQRKAREQAKERQLNHQIARARFFGSLNNVLTYYKYAPQYLKDIIEERRFPIDFLSSRFLISGANYKLIANIKIQLKSKEIIYRNVTPDITFPGSFLRDHLKEAIMYTVTHGYLMSPSRAFSLENGDLDFAQSQDYEIIGVERIIRVPIVSNPEDRIPLNPQFTSYNNLCGIDLIESCLNNGSLTRGQFNQTRRVDIINDICNIKNCGVKGTPQQTEYLQKVGVTIEDIKQYCHNKHLCLFIYDQQFNLIYKINENSGRTIAGITSGNHLEPIPCQISHILKFANMKTMSLNWKCIDLPKDEFFNWHDDPDYTLADFFNTSFDDEKDFDIINFLTQPKRKQASEGSKEVKQESGLQKLIKDLIDNNDEKTVIFPIAKLDNLFPYFPLNRVNNARINKGIKSFQLDDGRFFIANPDHQTIVKLNKHFSKLNILYYGQSLATYASELFTAAIKPVYTSIYSDDIKPFIFTHYRKAIVTSRHVKKLTHGHELDYNRFYSSILMMDDFYYSFDLGCNAVPYSKEMADLHGLFILLKPIYFHYFTLAPGAYYTFEIKTYLEDGVIKHEDISYFIKAARIFPNPYKDLATYLYKLEDELNYSSKDLLNRFVGTLGRRYKSESFNYYNNDKNTAYLLYTSLINRKNIDPMIEKINDTYFIHGEKRQEQDKGLALINFHIVARANLGLYQLYKQVIAKGLDKYVIGFNTDCIKFDAAADLSPMNYLLGSRPGQLKTKTGHIILSGQLYNDFQEIKYAPAVNEAKRKQVNLDFNKNFDINTSSFTIARGGSGKTTFLVQQAQQLAQQGKQVLITTTTHAAIEQINKMIASEANEANEANEAIASNRSVASKEGFKSASASENLRVGVLDSIINKMFKYNQKVEMLKKFDYIFIDEISMVNYYHFEFIYLVSKQKGFKAKIHCFGDPKQLPPVNSKGSHLDNYLLTDMPFFRLLCPNALYKDRIAGQCRYDEKTAKLTDEFANTALLNTKEWQQDNQIEKYNLHLTSTNNYRYNINTKLYYDRLRKMTKAITYNVKKIMYMNYIFKEKTINLFVGLPLICQVNEVEEKMINNKRYTITKLTNNYIELDNDIKLSPDDLAANFDLAYAITYHKSQGASIDMPYMLHEYKTATANHIYVGLTRTRKYENVFLYSDKGRSDEAKASEGSDEKIRYKFIDSHKVVTKESKVGLKEYETNKGKADWQTVIKQNLNTVVDEKEEKKLYDKAAAAALQEKNLKSIDSLIKFKKGKYTIRFTVKNDQGKNKEIEIQDSNKDRFYKKVENKKKEYMLL
jgi:hypothetical protein